MTNNSGDKRIKEQVGNLQVSFDKEAAWMRLQERLESKDETTPYFRIAWAAAAMLLVVTTFWYSFRDTQAVTVVKENPEVMTPAVSKQPLNEPRAEEIVVSTAQPIKKEKKHRLLKQPKAVEAVQKVTPVPALVKEEPAPIPEPVKIVATPKPKMKTVHINEVMQEIRYEKIMSNSRYAVEKGFLSPRKGAGTREYSYPIHDKTKALNDLEEEYRLLQN